MNNLPDMLKHIIYEFNPEHRPQMHKVMQEIKSLNTGVCRDCGENTMYQLNSEAFYNYRKYGLPFKHDTHEHTCQDCYMANTDFYGEY